MKNSPYLDKPLRPLAEVEEARVKDRAEAAACREACRGDMDAAGIKQLQAAFAGDWRAAYRKVMGSAP